MKANRWQRLWPPCVAAAALAAGLVASRWHGAETAKPPEIAGFVATEPRALPAFTLQNEKDKAFATADFRGAWSFIYFGYTYCPDICPISLAKLAQVKSLSHEADSDVVDNYYFVSVDPRRDTPERIGEYVHYFDPAFRGLTGKAGEIDKFARAAGIVYEVPDDPADDNYIVGHSSTVTLLNPDGNIEAFFTPPLDAKVIAKDFARVRQYYETEQGPAK